MFGRPLSAALRRSAIAAAIVAVLLLVVPVASAAPLTFHYAENGTAPVARFVQIQGAWGLEGDDSALFLISEAAVLSFKESPDFEDAKDANGDNTYEVVLVAYTGDGKNSEAVEVTVTDVEEAGKVTLSHLQPQVGRIFEATLYDPDAPVREQNWQWSRGPSVDGPWSSIAGDRSTPLVPVAADIGDYLRVTVTYTDKFGSGKKVSAVSENPVEAKPSTNAAPVFPVSARARAVDENKKDASVGRPVVAMDADGDILLYELASPSAEFTIDRRTGQIKTKGPLDSNPGPSNDSGNRTVNVVVIATDSSTASARQTVAITINDVNDKPAFPEPSLPAKTNLTAITIVENVTGADLRSLATYDATDDDRTDDVPSSELTYAVTGTDAKYFTIGNQIGSRGKLDIKASPNFERRSSYAITVTAMDDDRAAAELKVTVTVRNADDPGEVMLTQRTPEVGTPIAASLSDEDGSIRDVKWTWYGNAGGSWSQIIGANSSSYMPTAGEVGGLLQASVTYTDSLGTGRFVSAVTQDNVRWSNDVNTAPKFADGQDPNTAGNEAEAVRSVAENDDDANVGSPVRASDAEGDRLIYSLSGPDESTFIIGTGLNSNLAEGQIKTVEGLDYETKRQYRVIVTATDPSGASDSINVIINVTDVRESREIIRVPSIPGVSISRAAGSESAAGTLAVSWTAPSDDGGSAIIAYDLRYIETSADETIDSNWTVIADVWITGGGTLQHALTGLTEATQYDIQVRAVNARSDGLWSATATGTPTTTIVDEEINLRIAATRLSDGRTEFTLQERSADGSWAERRRPTARFFPATARVGRWLASSPLLIEFSQDGTLAEGETPGDIEVRIAAQLLADGRMEFALQERSADGSWAERRRPMARFFPANARVGRWLSSSPLAVGPAPG